MSAGWDLLRAERATLVPWFILVEDRGNMGDILDVFVRAAAICHERTWEHLSQLSVKRFTLISSPLLVITPLGSKVFRDNHAVTHCQSKAHTPSGAAPGWAWPCVCRLGDTPPPRGLRQSARPPNTRKPIARGERWLPSLQPQTRLEFSTMDRGRMKGQI